MENSSRDSGLQQERTALAWHRTGLTLVAASFIVGRLLLPALGTAVISSVALGVAAAVWAVTSTRRTAKYERGPNAESAFKFVLIDGRPPALVTGMVCLLCVVELSAILLT